jgi:transcriptional regulator with XRE-family HTH domain
MTKLQPAVVDPDCLRLARLKNRFRQRDIAARLGVAPQRVSDFEQGLRHPGPEQVAVLAEVLGREIFASTSENVGEPSPSRNRPLRLSGQKGVQVKSE